MPRFLDTNILLRYFTNDDPVKGRHALALLHRIERGEEKVAMSLLVVSETVFTLERHYKVPKDTEIYSWDTDFDKLPGLLRVEPDGHNG